MCCAHSPQIDECKTLEKSLTLTKRKAESATKERDVGLPLNPHARVRDHTRDACARATSGFYQSNSFGLALRFRPRVPLRRAGPRKKEWREMNGFYFHSAQAEANKTLIIKGKLEELCRELQKQNKSVLVHYPFATVSSHPHAHSTL